MAAFDDRVVSLDAPEQLASLGAVLGSRTRLAVLSVLVRSDQPLHINEVARRVGVDASPVRTHLELLLKEGIVRELETPTGRERKFSTALTNVRLALEGVNRAGPVAMPAQPPKTVQKLQKRLDLIAREIARLEEKARRTQDEMRKEWEKAAPKA